MQFDSLSDFIQMNGHGAYVWAVYIIGLVILFMNVLRPKMMMKRFYREQQRTLNLQAAVAKEKHGKEISSGEHSEK